MSPADGCRSSAVRAQGQPSGRERLHSIVSLQCMARRTLCSIFHRPSSGVAPLQLSTRSPETVAVEAVAEVKQLQAAIGVLGENSIHAKALHEALRVAQNKAKLPPIQEQTCKMFLERARKRVFRAQVVIDRAIEQKAVRDNADSRLSRSKLRRCQHHPWRFELCRSLQEKIDSDALRSRPDQPEISNHSDHVSRTFHRCRQPTCRSWRAIAIANSAMRWSSVGSIGSDVAMAGQSKSSGSQTPVHRRRQREWCSAVQIDSRSGLREVRVGEASNPSMILQTMNPSCQPEG